MTMHFRDLAAHVAADGAITPEEILSLRQVSWANGAIDADEADAIFAINGRVAEPTPEWSDYFVEAIGEFLINGVGPRGYVDQDEADWLMARIDHDGVLDSLTELELLVRLFERAEATPDALRTYALAQIEKAVVSGDGPTRRGSLDHHGVDATEARLLRRIIFSSGGERPAAVSRAEAKALFRIKNATIDADNAPEWKLLFVQGVGNYLMGFAGHEPLSMARAAELEEFMNDNHAALGRFAGRMAKADVGSGFRAVFGRKKISADLDAQVQKAEAIDEGEKLWLDTQIGADDRIDEYEQALLEWLAEEQRRS